MRCQKKYIGGRMRAAAGLMLLPLFAFLFFSCPVKRALLSAFPPVETVTYADVLQSHSAIALSGGDHHCQDIAVFEKVPILLPFNSSVTPVPVALLPVSILLQPDASQRAVRVSTNHYQPSFYHTHLFLENQSFLI